MEIADFLLARIADDEAVAREAHDRFEVGDRTWRLRVLDGGGVAAYTARVLAECEAKRRIVELYQRAQAAVETDQRRVDAGG